MTIQLYKEYFRQLACRLIDISHPLDANSDTSNHRFIFVRGDETIESSLRLLDLSNPCLLLFPFSSKLADNNSSNLRMQYTANFGIAVQVNKNELDDTSILNAIDTCRGIAHKVFAAVVNDSRQFLAFNYIDYNEVDIDDAHFSNQGLYGSTITFNWEEGIENLLVVDSADYNDVSL
jgi:hypothetical protein